MKSSWDSLWEGLWGPPGLSGAGACEAGACRSGVRGLGCNVSALHVVGGTIQSAARARARSQLGGCGGSLVWIKAEEGGREGSVGDRSGREERLGPWAALRSVHSVGRG